MQFSTIIGQDILTRKLISAFQENRVAHTQLFLGDDGYGSLAIAISYAQYLLCHDRTEDDSCGICPSCKKFEKIAHPDLHFYFPTATTQSVKKDPKSSLFLEQWREYIVENEGYITLNGWLDYLGVGNKQGYIRKDDANEVISKLSLKAYEGSYKVIIIWMIDKLNESSSNKLLKTFEEPPENTIIILIGNKYEQLLPTVRSRAQLVKIPRLKDIDITNKFLSNGLTDDNAHELALLSSGNWNTARELQENAGETQSNFLNFRRWLRLCFQPKDYAELIKFNQEMSKLGREKQKSFLNYGIEVIHNSIQNNFNNIDCIKKTGDELDFTTKFSQFINEANQKEIYKLLNEAIYHIERNAHAGIMYSDLSFKMVDLITKGRLHLKK